MKNDTSSEDPNNEITYLTLQEQWRSLTLQHLATIKLYRHIIVGGVGQDIDDCLIQRGNIQINPNEINSAMLKMNRIIGEGYRAGGVARIETSTAVIVRKNNNILTAYPML